MGAEAGASSRSVRPERAEFRGVTVLGLLAGLMVLAFSNRPLGVVSDITLRPDWVGAGLALGIVLTGLVRGWRLPRTTIILPFGAFLVVEFLSSFLSYSVWPSGIKFSFIYVLGFAYLCATLLLIRDRPTALWATSALVVLGVLASLSGVISVIVADFLRPRAVGASYRAYAETAGFFAARGAMNERNLFSSLLLVPFALALWRWGAERVRSWWAPACSALVAALVFGLTRAVWIAAAGMALVWLWRLRPSVAHIAFLILSGLVSLSVLLAADLIGRGVPLEQTGLYDRLVRGIVTGDDPTVAWRVVGMGHGLRAFAQAPWLGHGAGAANRVESILGLERRMVGPPWIPNALVFLLVEVGLAGLTAAIWIVVWAARETWKAGGKIPPQVPLALDREALLVGGGATLLAWQATHGLWQMYGYLYLGVLLAVTRLTRGEAA